MAEYIYTGTQSVAVNSNVLYNETVDEGCACVRHRKGSGIVNLKAGKYFVGFSADVTGATAGTEVSLAIALNGEPLVYTTMASTPATAGDYNNVATFTYINVPCGCCQTFSVENIGTTAMTVADANLIIKREG